MIALKARSQTRELLQFADKKLRRRAVAVMILSVFGAFAELLTVGSVIPLLVAAADPDRLSNLPVFGSLFSQVQTESFGGPVLASAILLTVSALIAGIIRLLVLWLSHDLVYKFHSRLIIAMYRGILYQDYEWFVLHNGSQFIATLEKVFATTANLFVSVVAAIPALIMSVAVLSFLLYLDLRLALAVAGAIGSLYVVLGYFALRSVDEISLSATVMRDRRTRFAQETWGAARDIIIDHSQSAYLAKVTTQENEFAILHVRSGLIGLAPRIIVDASIVMLVSAVVVLLASTPAELLVSLPLLGAFAIGGQRLIPMVQQVYLTYANQKIYAAYIEGALAYARLRPSKAAITRPDPGLSFKSTIELENVTLKYPNGVTALREVDLLIHKGSKIGVIGKTGSGKSTLVDIIMGLLLPNEGAIKVDGTRLSSANLGSWRSKIAHVPQSIFLADDTLLANVALGARVDSIDIERAKQACFSAGLSEFIDQHPDGLMRTVGERGIQLSGGQRQRIGIARALYKGVEVLILDEATSALDLETEAAILDLVYQMRDVTVLMVSHRRESLARCDRIVMLKNGNIVGS